MSYTFAQKLALLGSNVIGSEGFENSSVLVYSWDPAGASNAPMVALGVPNVPYNTLRIAGSANCIVADSPSVPGFYSIPKIDNTLFRTFGGGVGSLKLTIPSNSPEGCTGYFSQPFAGMGTGRYIAPGSPDGNVVYMQWYQRFSTEMLSTSFTAGGGWKQAICFGDPAIGMSSSNNEISWVNQNTNQRGVPCFYCHTPVGTGIADPGVQDIRGCTFAAQSPNYLEPPCIRYKANSWMEFTQKFTVNTNGGFDSRIEIWVNGDKIIDNSEMYVLYSGGTSRGIGQWMFTGFHTGKSAAQVHPECYTWYDDLIISKAPIPMTNLVASTAENMAVGSFSQIFIPGYDWTSLNDAEGAGSVGSIFGFGTKAVYDSDAEQVLYAGSAHNQSVPPIFKEPRLKYLLSTNMLSFDYASPAPNSVPGQVGGHSYGNNAIDVARSLHYHGMQLVAAFINRYNVDTYLYEAMATPDSAGAGDEASALEYFPERDELIFINKRRLYIYKYATNTWTLSAQTPSNLAIQDNSPALVYSPTNHCVLLVGGWDRITDTFSRAVYKYDSSGILTRLNDAPAHIKVATSRCLVTCDPVSGKYLFVQCWMGTSINDFKTVATPEVSHFFDEYDISTDTWTSLNASLIPNPDLWWGARSEGVYPFGVVSTPINTYGVIMFMSATNGGVVNGSLNVSRVFLYKHGASSPPPPSQVKYAHRLRVRN